LLNLNQD